MIIILNRISDCNEGMEATFQSEKDMATRSL